MHAATGPFRRVFPGRPGSQVPGRPAASLRDGPAVSPGGSSSAAARTPRGSIQPAAGAGSRTRCRRGSPRDGASGTVRRSWSLLCSARRPPNPRTAKPAS